MATPIQHTEFERVYHELAGFDKAEHLLTTDLKVVKRNSFTTWLGRIFTPHKYRASNVVHSLQRHIHKHGRKGQVNIQVQCSRTRELITQRTIISLGSNQGLNQFLGALSNRASQQYGSGANKLKRLANKLEKLLYAKSTYLDTPLRSRASLSSIEQLKGKVVLLDLDKPTKPADHEKHIDEALKVYPETQIEQRFLDQEAHRVYTTVLVIREMETDEKRQLEEADYGPERALSYSYSRARDDLKMDFLASPLRPTYQHFNEILPFKYEDFEDRVSRLSPPLAQRLTPCQRAHSV